MSEIATAERERPAPPAGDALLEVEHLVKRFPIHAGLFQRTWVKAPSAPI